MDSDAKTVLRHACRTLLRPLALILLRGGMTWREFADISKAVFVDVATGHFGVRGRPTNVSKTSILTGISRKEVKRQRELLAAAEPALSNRSTDATRVLSGWYQDPDFRGDDDLPLQLPETGPGPSFETLFSKYGGDTPRQTLLRELLAAGSVARDENDHLRALRRYHMPQAMDTTSLRFMGMNLHDHAQTLADNLAGDAAKRRLEGFAVQDRIDPAAVEAFREFLDQRGQAFLEEIDDWLTAHRLPDDDTSTEPARLGLGLFAIEGTLPEGRLS